MKYMSNCDGEVEILERKGKQVYVRFINTGYSRWANIDNVKAGWLSFGLGISLPVGKYRFEIDYVSKSSPNAHVGNWDVVLDNEKKLGNGKLMGSEGKTSRIEGVFVIEPEDVGKSFELRTFFLAQGDLQVISSSVQIRP